MSVTHKEPIRTTALTHDIDSIQGGFLDWLHLRTGLQITSTNDNEHSLVLQACLQINCRILKHCLKAMVENFRL